MPERQLVRYRTPDLVPELPRQEVNTILVIISRRPAGLRVVIIAGEAVVIIDLP